MGVNAHWDYADRKNGRKPITPIHPELDEPLREILDETYGLIVYQEQIMRISQKVANYTAGEADGFRKAMGKKKPEVLAQQYDKSGRHAGERVLQGSDGRAVGHDRAVRVLRV